MATVSALVNRSLAERCAEVRHEDAIWGGLAAGAARGGPDRPPGDPGGRAAASHRRPITFPARYLHVNGLWGSVRASARARRRAIIAAYGIDEQGAHSAARLSPRGG